MTDGNDQLLAEDFERLRERCVDLRVLSNEFKRLFSDEDKLTLDAVGPAIFQVVHDCMIEVWWLRAGRLMDPAKTGKRENLTIANIVERMQAVFEDQDEIDLVWTSLQTTWEKMKPARNKQIAHSDLEAARDDIWLGTLTETEDEGFENSLQNICDLIGTKLGVGPLDFQSTGCSGDASDLIDFLRFGLRAKLAWAQEYGADSSVRGMFREDQR